MNVRALPALAIVLAVLVGDPGPPPLVFAHRGDTTVAPENTIASVEAAATWADGIEIDVRRADDGTWWLRHDEGVLGAGTGLAALPDAIVAAGDRWLILDMKAADATVDDHLELAAMVAGRPRTAINVTSQPGADAIESIAPQIVTIGGTARVPESPRVGSVDVWIASPNEYRDPTIGTNRSPSSVLVLAWWETEVEARSWATEHGAWGFLTGRGQNE